MMALLGHGAEKEGSSKGHGSRSGTRERYQ